MRRIRSVKEHIKGLERDLLIVLLSITFAVLLVKTEALEAFLSATSEMKIIGSVVSGIFFTSIFTVAPATIALAEIGQTISPFTVALFGALGAMMGDLIILFFIKDIFAEDIKGVFRRSKWKKFLSLFHMGLWRWMMPLIGAAIIASPLPDELGLTFMGISKIKKTVIMPLVFLMNFGGIIAIIYVTRLFQ
ncbi:MAG: hypothetical protein A3G52_02910 [Candidatus Taylorbacteria bacterium RIFCSPLOWO2_12_FULL_43_20]|uniref:TVP38/TMEM64 family membrane protein n=1 Tax=Candidatus Taylorbacteria bacterium RIFCSPLOWO2_12_FULL_43_20 TaxID=1802332 RepID=A0A1G2P583_9BACT|nr:MAG: hypothetical protein A2825_03955 [Candidatus Taylorbacteria bacterium RIFCSPHIGHO2_01_FULL_43_120]OHA24194.1 MAG: hypothetical protein A3B98_00030 [Candidatus Taylorbacteria bacterium RIFCSPHIGHO2_02_FULL_43_55]OHA28159.1 MAG: hypothetical protein A3E92_02050 [Candidatus Taylorbacteria bacterium RIFCSPHIGHO2_12_FULL_42_34]OHA32185.1 MAG: hypothetical protein A3B09_00885 [Candidatus Taylorbacteria bacterium RIFCSPLOWO2_01_FULL_43_83]OHA39695.1 MAG: hypothetical protein A3H58_04535 [Candi